MVTNVLHAQLYVNATDPGSAGLCWTEMAAKITSNVEKNTTEEDAHTPGSNGKQAADFRLT